MVSRIHRIRIIGKDFCVMDMLLSNDFSIPSLFKVTVVRYNNCKLLEMRGDFYV